MLSSIFTRLKNYRSAGPAEAMAELEAAPKPITTRICEALSSVKELLCPTMPTGRIVEIKKANSDTKKAAIADALIAFTTIHSCVQYWDKFNNPENNPEFLGLSSTAAYIFFVLSPLSLFVSWVRFRFNLVNQEENLDSSATPDVELDNIAPDSANDSSSASSENSLIAPLFRGQASDTVSDQHSSTTPQASSLSFREKSIFRLKNGALLASFLVGISESMLLYINLILREDKHAGTHKTAFLTLAASTAITGIFGEWANLRAYLEAILQSYTGYKDEKKAENKPEEVDNNKPARGFCPDKWTIASSVIELPGIWLAIAYFLSETANEIARVNNYHLLRRYLDMSLPALIAGSVIGTPATFGAIMSHTVVNRDSEPGSELNSEQKLEVQKRLVTKTMTKSQKSLLVGESIAHVLSIAFALLCFLQNIDKYSEKNNPWINLGCQFAILAGTAYLTLMANWRTTNRKFQKDWVRRNFFSRTEIPLTEVVIDNNNTNTAATVSDFKGALFGSQNNGYQRLPAEAATPKPSLMEKIENFAGYLCPG